MARPVGQNIGVKAKNATADRAEVIKKLQAYYMKQRRKHGAGRVSLRFSNSQKRDYAGLYRYAKDGKPAQITVVLPQAKAWADNSNASKGSPRIKPSTALAEGKAIINAELAHHRETLERAGHPSNKSFKIGPFKIGGRDAHGPRYKTAVKKVGPMPGDVMKMRRLANALRKPKKRLGSNRSMSGNA